MLEDEDALRNVMQGAAPEVIIHLAAQAGVRHSLQNPRAYVSANLVGDQVIVEPDRQQFLTLGAVSHPGLQDIAKPTVTLLEAIAQAGGLSDSSTNPNGVFYVTNAPVYEFQKLIAPLVQALIIGRSGQALSN